jgi:hypothetical protein
MKCILRNKQPDFTKVVKIGDEVIATIHASTKKDEGFCYSYAMYEDDKLDPMLFTLARIYRSLVGHGAGWKLKDENDKDIELSIDNINLLPTDIYNALALAVLDINSVDEEVLGNLNEQSS